MPDICADNSYVVISLQVKIGNDFTWITYIRSSRLELYLPPTGLTGASLSPNRFYRIFYYLVVVFHISTWSKGAPNWHNKLLCTGIAWCRSRFSICFVMSAMWYKCIVFITKWPRQSAKWNEKVEASIEEKVSGKHHLWPVIASTPWCWHSCSSLFGTLASTHLEEEPQNLEKRTSLLVLKQCWYCFFFLVSFKGDCYY